MTTVEIKTGSGIAVQATYGIDGGNVTLSQEGHVVGAGRVRYGQETLSSGVAVSYARIEDADARLGATDGSETEEAYSAIETAIAERLDAEVQS